jgi:hypothetical protein
LILFIIFATHNAIFVKKIEKIDSTVKKCNIDMQKRFSCFLLILLFLSINAQAQSIDRSTLRGNSSFAIVTDSQTALRCGEAIDDYRKSIEADGLPVIVVSHDWSSPEQIKEVLQKLYTESNLEGCVFIGDIPIPMVTKAQHLTSAFKMNERENPLRDVAVPSDRFYDDFDLKFAAQGTEHDGLMFFYELAPDSPQYIECDIYSARIKPQKSDGDGYAQISSYLHKAVTQREADNSFDNFVSYTGDGSYSNSLVAWRAELQTLGEQFPGVFTTTNNAKFLRYSMEPYMKEAVSKELRRKDLDYMVFHEHGMAHRQYLTGENPVYDDSDDAVESVKRSLRRAYRRSPERAAKMAASYNVDSTWYADAHNPEFVKLDSLEDLRRGIIVQDVDAIAPNAKVVLFDACYNGDFNEDDFIAGKYIFADGDCVVGLGNSVNVLQDKSAFDLLGLLGCGVRVGTIWKYTNILESHIIGDPTFAFAPRADLSVDVNDVALSDDTGRLVALTKSDIPDVANLAYIKLYRAHYQGISDMLLAAMKESPYWVVRYNAWWLLEKTGGEAFKKAVIQGVSDSFEYIRRVSVNRMGAIGDERFIPYLVSAYVNDYNSARVVFNINEALRCFDKHKVVAAIDDYFAKADFYNAAKRKAELLEVLFPPYMNKDGGQTVTDGETSLKTIMDKSEDAEYRKSYIAFLKNRHYHQFVDDYLKLISDESDDPEIRLLMVESLAWFDMSVQKEKIVDTCKTLLTKGGLEPEMEKELRRTVNRLKSVTL